MPFKANYLIYLLFFILAISLFVLMKWTFSDSLYFKKNTIKYYVLLSTNVKKTPLYGLLGEPIFYYSSEGSYRQAITYTTSFDRDHVFNMYKAYFGNKSSTNNGALLALFSDYHFSVKMKSDEVKIQYLEN